MIKERQIKSGKLLEIDLYPTFNDGRTLPTRAPKTKMSTAAQEKYNRIQSQKRMIRLINTNFDESDIFLHITFAAADAPLDKDAALKEFRKYIRRVKAKIEKELKRIEKLLESNPHDQRLIAEKERLSKPFKYLGSCECVTYKTGVHKGKFNFHFHIFLSGNLDRDTLEELWEGKGRINADRFQPERFGVEAAGRYILKNTSGKCIVLRSHNLEKPKPPKYKDKGLTRSVVERIAKQRVDDAAYWQNRYKGYRFLKCYARYNSYNGYYYVSAILYKTDKDITPEWNAPEWIVWK